jgi:methylenetetrahydrofolate dehydrogenase (NADP+)/methenyltetrahydrofolate cyclohydrolase
MAAEIIDGKKIAGELLEELAKEIKEKGLKPKLATVLVGENPASKTYVRNKVRACEKIGVESVLHELPDTTTQEELLELVNKLNEDASVHGILVQLPLPEGIDKDKVIEAVAPEKDVDGFKAVNLGKVLSGDESMPSCTPAGVIHLLEKAWVQLEGADAVVVGRSITVGKPVAALLLNRSATVTVCHSRTKELGEVTKKADVLIVAVGKAKMIKADMVKPGATVIDVGINRVEGKLAGDVDFDSVKEVAGKITPVPGGVGPMTVACLMRNTVRACERATS